METWFTPAGDDDPGNNRHKGDISEPGLPFQSHKIRKHSSEKWCGCPNRLIKAHGQIPQGDIPADNGSAEDETEGGDLEELDRRPNRLQRNNAEPSDSDVAEEGAGSHVAHCEEDWVLEAVIREEELVEEEDTNVGRVPRRYETNCEEPAR